MIQKKFVIAFGQIQELFQQLSDEGKISPEQAQLFDSAQKDIVNFYSWVQNQIDGNIKVELPWTEPEFVEAWTLWKKFKKEKNFTYKIIGEQSALNRLTKLAKGNMNMAIEILEQSRGNGWSGLFELKTEKVITKKSINQKPGQILQSDKTKQYDGWD